MLDCVFVGWVLGLVVGVECCVGGGCVFAHVGD